MGATNNTVQTMPFHDFRLELIRQKLDALNRWRKASDDVRRVLTAPIVNRVEADMRAIERIRQLTTLPLPKFDVKDEE
jgi:hypothetical protein